MLREVIATDGAPAAVGPYSQAIRVGNLVFTAGQIGLDPATGAPYAMRFPVITIADMVRAQARWLQGWRSRRGRS
mgnify:CR=1 FL=1